jgi:hypothetical protein
MMEGMRYERGGKGKYWIPKPGEVNARTPLLGAIGSPSGPRSSSPSKPSQYMGYGDGTVEEDNLDPDEERLYDKARKLTFGDWNVSVPCHSRLSTLIRRSTLLSPRMKFLGRHGLQDSQTY